MVECPYCEGRPPYQPPTPPCHVCGGTGSVPLHRAVVWAYQHPGSPAWRRLILPTLAKMNGSDTTNDHESR